MGVKVEIINDNLVLMPSNTVEQYGLEGWLCNVICESSDPESIKKRISIDTELILEKEFGN